MNTFEEESYLLGDISRRLSNIIRIGKIIEVDFNKAKAKVKIGLTTTDFLPWVVARAGYDRSWKPLDLGEQVIILSPDGDLNRGIILAALYQAVHSAPSTSENKHVMFFGDGSNIEYDKSTNSLFFNIKGNINLIADGVINLSAKTANITADTTTINGDLITTGNVSLGGGGAAVARIGDTVSVDPNTHQGNITTGSTKVTAGG